MATWYNSCQALNYIVLLTFLNAVVGRSHLGGGRACWQEHDIAGHIVCAVRKQKVVGKYNGATHIRGGCLCGS